MPFLNLEPLSGGEEVSWSQLTFAVGGAPLIGVRGIKWSDKTEMEDVNGATGLIYSRGYGRRKISASLTVLGSTLFALIKQAPKGNIARITPTQLVFQQQPLDGPLTTFTFKKLQFKGYDFDLKEGDMSKDIELECIISDIVIQ
jgi:hypothetical protein